MVRSGLLLLLCRPAGCSGLLLGAPAVRWQPAVRLSAKWQPAVRLCATPEPEPGSGQKVLRDMLEGEAKALSFSWRTARLVIYAGFGLGALAGLSSTVPALTSAEPIDGDGGVLGVAVDAIILFGAIAGAAIDSQAAAQPSASPSSRTRRTELQDWSDAAPLRIQLRVSDREVKAAPIHTCPRTCWRAALPRDRRREAPQPSLASSSLLSIHSCPSTPAR